MGRVSKSSIDILALGKIQKGGVVMCTELNEDLAVLGYMLYVQSVHCTGCTCTQNIDL